MKHKLVIFDLDGTLLNTYDGIVNAYRYAAKCMNIPQPTEELLTTVIGASLKDVFTKEYGLSNVEAEQAIRYYRSYYKEKGQYEASVYDGIEDTLRKIKDEGVGIGLATLKAEVFAKSMLSESGIIKYFDCIAGMNTKDSLAKSDLIKFCVDCQNIEPNKTILIGDSKYDVVGAEQCGISFLGVSYGFGIKCDDRIDYLKCVGIAHTPNEIFNILENVG